MEKKDLIILVNCDTYVEARNVLEYSKNHSVVFAPLKRSRKKYGNETLILDLPNALWSYNSGIFPIGGAGLCHRDDSIAGVYDRSIDSHIQRLLNDATTRTNRDSTKGWG